jgi:hypothetical protein
MADCTTCGKPLAAGPPPPGMTAPAWAHASPPADGHEPGVPPIVVTYARHGDWHDAQCPGVPGFPVTGARGLGEAKSVAWALLGKVSPPRPVIERGADGAA